MKRHLVLTGLPGSGKTTVGRAVAERLGAAFTDLDEVVELTTGRSVSEVFRTLGEPRFREMERAAMDGALDAPAHVVAPGAGWMAQPGNLEAAERAAALVVYLRIAPESAAARLVGDVSRPLLLGNETEARLKSLLQEREAGYLRSGLAVDASPGPAAVAEAVVRAARAEAGW